MMPVESPEADSGWTKKRGLASGNLIPRSEAHARQEPGQPSFQLFSLPRPRRAGTCRLRVGGYSQEAEWSWTVRGVKRF